MFMNWNTSPQIEAAFPQNWPINLTKSLSKSLQDSFIENIKLNKMQRLKIAKTIIEKKKANFKGLHYYLSNFTTKQQ